jgi:hypothetical protein
MGENEDVPTDRQKCDLYADIAAKHRNEVLAKVSIS